jgi:hypothetical protein
MTTTKQPLPLTEISDPSDLTPAQRLSLHLSAPAWMGGLRGEVRMIRGTLVSVRSGYSDRLLHQCCVCGDFRDAEGWSSGSALRQHRISHGLCPTCRSDYYGDRARLMEGVAS